MSFQIRRISGEPKPRSFPWLCHVTSRMMWLFVRMAGLALASPLLWVFKRFRRKQEEEQQAEEGVKRGKILRRLIKIVLICGIVLLFLAGAVQALVAFNIVNIHTVLQVVGKDLPQDSDGFTNFLILGKGDADHDGADLTDTMMVASVDPRTRSVVLLSIPRDLYVKSEEMGEGRINELYRNAKEKLRRGGMSKEEASKEALRALMRELDRRLNVQLHHAVMVNFSGFVQTVDALGGIDVNVPEDIVDPEYPGPDWTYQTFTIKAGHAHLDGVTTLKYARSRHTTNDFGRSARQQQILQALSERARSVGLVRSPSKLLSLLHILSTNVETTMTAQELLGSAKLSEYVDRSRVISMQLNDASGPVLTQAGGFLYTPPREAFGGASVLLPISSPSVSAEDQDGWGEIRTFLSLLLHARTLYLSHPRIAVLNAGAKPGLAGRLATELIRYGFAVERVENAELPPPFGSAQGRPPGSRSKRGSLETSFIFTPPPDAPSSGTTVEPQTAAASFFASLLTLSMTLPPSDLPLEQQEPVTILLGKDFTFTPFHTILQEPEPAFSAAP